MHDAMQAKRQSDAHSMKQRKHQGVAILFDGEDRRTFQVSLMNTNRIGWLILIPWLLLPATNMSLRADQPESRTRPADLHSKAGFHWLVQSYCVVCHNQKTLAGGLDFETLLDPGNTEQRDILERMARRISAGEMPPNAATRPAPEVVTSVLSWLHSSLDEAAAKHPDPGHSEALRRLTRAQYQNAIRDLLAFNADVSNLLPADELSHGFDNITVTGLSPTLVNRYLTAAEKISQLAVGRVGTSPAGETFRLRPDVTQDVHLEGLPLGTRGGIRIPYMFPAAGEYEVQVHLMRDRNEEVEGLKEAHDLEISVDRTQAALFNIAPPSNGGSDHNIDADLSTRIQVTAGTHDIAVAFLQKSGSLLESTRQPLNVHFNFYRHPRLGPAVYEITILGPFGVSKPGESLSRQRIFTARPESESQEEACAQQILQELLRNAYRRPVEPDDLTSPMKFFQEGRAKGGFELGIERALSSILLNPHFLFRIETEPVDAKPGMVYSVSDIALASRSSFFLWNSIPDEELLQLAERHQLHNPVVLDEQIRRMLADPRSESLVKHFAGQWLHLQNLDAATPDMRLFPDFDDNLRQAMRTETNLFFASLLKEDCSVLDLLSADYTFLNERLAKHYGIPNVYGSRFRRVSLSPESHRGGLLRQGSILTVTSYATRTSPVLRGKWILENLLGSPPAAPPPNIPNLSDNTVLATLSVRERLAAHRADAACASCHNVIDPVGFSLENFDAVGRWRDLEEGKLVDATGGLPDGSDFVGVHGIQDGLLLRPEVFVRCLTEKLMTYALGRGLEPSDAPAIRRILAESRGSNYRFSSLISGIVRSVPFQMRRSK